MKDNFGALEKIIDETIKRMLKTKNLDLQIFFQQMENEFARLGYREKSSAGVKNILISRFDNIGDFVLSTPAIRAVRENFPDAFITLVVSETAYPLAEICPYVNEVFAFDINFDANNFIEVFKRVTNFAKKHLWKRHYNLAFHIQYWFTPIAPFFLYLSGAKERVAYSRDKLYSELINHDFSHLQEVYHDVINNLNLLKLSGLKTSSTDTEIWFDDSDLFKAETLLKGFAEDRFKISVAIGSSNAQIARRYPVEKYLEAFKILVDKGAAIVIFGGPAELEGANFLEKNLPEGSVKNFVKLHAGWRVDAAAMSLTDMYIGNFTGACDVAASLKLPIIALTPESKDRDFLFEQGFSQIAHYYPWKTFSIVLRPAHQLDDCAKEIYYGGCQKKTSHCIAQIEPSEIVDAFDKMTTDVNEIKFFDGDFKKIFGK